MFVFFDIDETLLDQKQAEAAAAKHLMSAYADLLERPYSVAEFCRVWRFLREKHNTAFFAGEIPLGEQRRRRVRELFAHGGKPLADADADALFAFYEYHYRKHWGLFDDVLPFLESMSGISCGVISNGSTEQQKRKLRRTGIERYFEVVIVSEEIGAAKPRREIFLAACRRARLPARQCIYVGDRLEQDALASCAAGMRGFWLDRSGKRAAAPVEVIGSLSDLCWKLESRIAV